MKERFFWDRSDKNGLHIGYENIALCRDTTGTNLEYKHRNMKPQVVSGNYLFSEMNPDEPLSPYDATQCHGSHLLAFKIN